MGWKDDVAARLAREHYKIEPGITRILRLSRADGNEDAPGEPVKLLEVNEHTIPTGIQPLHFGPAPQHGITCPSVIIEVTPEEFARIERGELKLPAGWRVEADIPKPAALAGVE